MQQKRYHDAQLISEGYISVGGIIKGLGITLAFLLVLVALMLGRNGDFAAMIAGFVLVVLTGILFFGVGTLLSAVGQMLLATVDTAENTLALGGLAENTQVLREIKSLLLEGKAHSMQVTVDKQPEILAGAVPTAPTAPTAPAAA